jgi:hypothetical protein
MARSYNQVGATAYIDISRWWRLSVSENGNRKEMVLRFEIYIEQILIKLRLLRNVFFCLME